MPEPARTAWGALAMPLGSHASDADYRKSSDPDERTRHFIDIDYFEPHPFRGVPHTLEGMRKKYGAEDAVKWGVAPWAIDECYRMLVLSLERGDWASAGAWGADLGHYVADTHQPLHVCVNYDGQKTGNDGIHLRFEVHMMDRHYGEASLVPAGDLPDPGSNVTDFALRWIAEAYTGIPVILAGDETARGLDADYGPRYLESLWGSTSSLAEIQVSRAVRDLAALYTAAWKEAGSPPGPAEAPSFRALPKEDLDPPPPPPGSAPLRALLLAGGVLASALLAVSF
ncbi:hypothetical protein K8I85_04355 [bacterium]|nr:hypothetical protein [bacterium]